MNVSDYIAKWLRSHGIATVYGLPGEENLYLLDAIRKEGLTYMRTDHEASAGFMASAEARVTGKMSVVMTTLGPGATNVLTAIAHAHLGGIPLLLITPDKPGSMLQGNFQRIDTVELFEPVTNYSFRVSSPTDIIPALENAYMNANYTKRPGVSHIQIPIDISNSEINVSGVEVADHKMNVVTSKDLIIKAREFISLSKRPILLLAGGSQDRDTSKVINRIVEKHKIYTISTPMGKGSVNENSHYYIGTVISEIEDPLQKAINYADLIIAIGYESHERPFSLKANGDKRVLSLNTHYLELDEYFIPDIQIVGNQVDNLERLFEDISLEGSEDEFFDSVKTFTAKTPLSGNDAHLRDLVEMLNDILLPEDFVVLDNGSYKSFFSRSYRCSRPDQLILDNSLATMGGGMAMGASISHLHPENKVVTVVGDGGFLMSSYDLGIIKRFSLHQKVIMLRDEKYNMISQKQLAMGLPEFGVGLDIPDVGRLVEAYGIPYSWIHIRETAQIMDEIQQDGNRFIEVYY